MQRNRLVIIFTLFFVLYALISLVNHYNFRTFALDLGLYNKALFDYSHFHWSNSLLFKTTPENLLSSHFDLYLLFFSPLRYLFGTYTLLIIQIISILFGGLGIFKYFSAKFPKQKKIILFSLLYFFLSYGIYSALSYDYHSSVVASMFVPWLFYYVERKDIKKIFIITIIILIAKENMAFWVSFIFIGLMIEYRKDTTFRKYLGLFFLLSTVYFLFVTKIIMPHLANSNRVPFEQYSFWGNSFSEILNSFFSSDKNIIIGLFTNHTHHLHGDYVKLEFLFFLFISGVYMLVKKPYYLIMIIPLLAQKLLHNNYLIWGIDSHYSIGFVPILTIGIFTIIANMKQKKWRTFFSYLVLISSIVVTVRLMDNTILFTSKSKIRFYQKEHYKRNYDVKKVYQALKLIPDHSAVSAQSPFVPHLAFRNSIYQFPILKDANYVVYSTNEEFYPLSKEEFHKKIKLLINQGWHKIYDEDGFSILTNASEQ